MAFVQQATGSVADGGTLAYGSNVGSGVALFAIVAFSNSARSVVGITDTRGNTWTLVRKNSDAAGNAIELWKAHCATGGANTITGDWDAATSPQVHISEFDSFPNDVTVDQSNEQDNVTTLTPHYGSITTTQATSVAIAAGRSASAFSVVTVGDGFTAFTYGANQVSHYKVLSGTETFDCDLVMAATETMAGVIANMYNAGGGGGLAIPVVTRQFRERWM